MVKKKIKLNTKATREIDKYPWFLYTGLIFAPTAHGNLLMAVRKQSFQYVLLKVIY